MSQTLKKLHNSLVATRGLSKSIATGSLGKVMRDSHKQYSRKGYFGDADQHPVDSINEHVIAYWCQYMEESNLRNVNHHSMKTHDEHDTSGVILEKKDPVTLSTVNGQNICSST